MTAAPVLLDCAIIVDRGTFRLDLPLTIASGEVVALLGPNGAGKTTALRALAGLLRLSDGHVIVGGHCLDDPWRRMFVPPERRPIGVVFQDYLLFPHLSVEGNVAFGPRCHGLSRHDAHRTARQWLHRVGLAELAQHKPRRLSGGQAQRVALARALAVEPTLLLLDEPLAALDARTRLDTRAHLHRHLADHPGATLLVTHDPLDALVLADRLVIIEAGRVVQQGDAATITTRPRTDYVARLVGLNLCQATASGRSVAFGHELVLTVAEPVDCPVGAVVFVAFPPSAVTLYGHRPDGSIRNTWPATVAGVQRHGDHLRVELTGPVACAADLMPAAAARLSLTPGAQVWAGLEATKTQVYLS